VKKSATEKTARREERGATLLLISGLAFALLTPPSSLLASSDNAGTKNGNFLKLATDARGTALGNLMSSMAQGAESLRWNPAGLALSEMREAVGTHVEYYQGIRLENLSYAHPLGEGALGGNLFYMTAGELDGRDLNGNPTGDFDFYNMVGSVGYGHKVYTRSEGADIYLGGEVKIVQEKIADQSFNNAAIDVGVMVSPIDNLMTGVALRNLSSSKADFPREITGSATYTPPFLKLFTGGVGFSYANDAPMRYTVGGEYKIPEYYNTALRASYQNTDDLDDSEDSAIKGLRGAGLAGLRFGTGFEYRAPVARELRLGLDYTMAPFGALGISHTITVKVKW